MELVDYKDAVIKDLTAKNFKFAEVFESFGIDFCCKGNRPVGSAAEEKGIDIDLLNEKLNAVTVSKETNRYDEWDLDYLADFIVNNHHKYVAQAIPLISAHTEKIANVHGTNHPELAEVRDLFLAIAAELTSHMAKEEKILFPAIKKMIEVKKNDQKISSNFSVEQPIMVMENEHLNAGGILERLREITNNYITPQDGCTTYQVTFKELEEFELDLHKHIFLENGILFPKAIELEKQLKGE